MSWINVFPVCIRRRGNVFIIIYYLFNFLWWVPGTNSGTSQEIRVRAVACDRSSICDITTRKTTTNRTSGVETKLPEQQSRKHLKRRKQDDGRIKNHSRGTVKWFEVEATDSGSGCVAHLNLCRKDLVLSSPRSEIQPLIGQRLRIHQTKIF